MAHILQKHAAEIRELKHNMFKRKGEGKEQDFAGGCWVDEGAGLK